MFSVLLSAYKKESPAFLNQALLSIYDEQLLKPNQIVLVKDGPLTSELDEVISAWQERLSATFTVLALPQNVGLGAALNEGLKYCQHELVARMDTDDIATPNRFSAQVSYFNSTNNLDVLGSSAYLFSSELSHSSIRKVPLTHDELLNNLWACPFIHPSIMFKKTSILAVGGYNPNLRRRQDYELWFRCAEAGLNFANIEEPLLYYRFSEDTHKRQSVTDTWQQGVIGFRGSSTLGLAYWKRLACFVPFVRSLFPARLQHGIYLFLSKFDPRRA